MLGIHRLSSHGADYYLADLAGELPLLTGDDGRCEWFGRAGEGLGLQGRIDPGALRNVLQGCHPSTGRRLAGARASVLGYDLTFSAPKSVSVLCALSGDEAARQVVAAHREAVGGALSYLECHALSAQRGSGEDRTVVPTSGMIAATFTHGVNRNLDPHLHSHALAANLVHGADGRWSACDQRGLSAHRRAAGAVYEAHLRLAISARLGVGWEPTPGLRAEVRGVSPHLMGEFSSRSADIRRHLAAWGSHSQRGRHIAWVTTRPEKQSEVSFAELSREWRRRAHAAADGIDLAAVQQQGAPTRPGGALDEYRFAASLSHAPDAAARRRDVVAAFGTGALDGASAEALGRLADLWVPLQHAAPEVGVAEATHSLRSVVPDGHLLRALGPRPVDVASHEVWRSAAQAIDTYRDRWQVTTRADALGADALWPGLSALPADRLVDHVRTARQIASARQRLGWREPVALEMERAR